LLNNATLFKLFLLQRTQVTQGRLLYVLKFTMIHGKIAEADLVSDPERISQLDLAVLSD